MRVATIVKTVFGCSFALAAAAPDLAELDQTPMAWTPTLFLEIEPARHVLPSVQSHAGPFPW